MEPDAPGAASRLTVSAVILSYNRADALQIVLDRLAQLPVDEVLVFDNGSSDGSAAVTQRRGGNVRLLAGKENVGIAGRNAAARQATGDLLLMLDDDSYPLPGAVETLVAAFQASPQLGAAGAAVREVDRKGTPLAERGLGSFDWWLQGAGAAEPLHGLPAFFFPEGACILRRSAYLEAGGFFEPYFLACSELDLATRLISLGWDVRYFPTAVFEHMKPDFRRGDGKEDIYYRVRNHVWYLWLHFPASLALRRIPAYLAFDLIDATYRRAPSAWARAVADAWRQRELVRHARRPIRRDVARRAELNRGRLHLRLLLSHLGRRARRARDGS